MTSSSQCHNNSVLVPPRKPPDPVKDLYDGQIYDLKKRVDIWRSTSGAYLAIMVSLHGDFTGRMAKRSRKISKARSHMFIFQPFQQCSNILLPPNDHQ